jgi:ABC-type multidrug transport system fused ATPase/permease subunit
MRSPSLVRYYAGEVRRVLRHPARLAAFVLSCALHAVGHALVALVAGGIVVALARAWGLPAGRSSPLGSAGSLSEQAFVLSAVGLGVVLVKGAAGVYATFVQARVAGEVGGRLRLELLDALLAVHRLRRPRHGDQGVPPAMPPAQALSALTDRVHDVERGLQLGLLGGARAVAQLVPLGVVLVVIAPRMAGVAIAVLVAFGLLLGRLRAGYRAADRGAVREREHLLQAADEAVRHADLWVTYGAEAKARAAVREIGRALARGTARLEARAVALSGANEVLGAAALLAAMGAARAGWLGRVAGGETLLAFAVAFFLAYRPLRELAEARLALGRAESAHVELRGVIDQERDTVEAAEARRWSPGALELRSLRLAHGACGPLSLLVAPGTIVAIAGPTGVGKTTLLRTLLGLDAAAGGEILFDGASLEHAPAGPSARPFAWVPQEAPLLADTLAANVTLGASGADARESLDPIGASHLTADLLGARLGPGGRAVSGGERQWIALARAIATCQPVLLLDEPTSGLDAESQRRVLDAIALLRGKRTVVIVTHRPEPLAVADEVVHLVAA